ncbi:hypothetical protein ACI2KT_25390 [Ensifer adhaerens]|uniref:hypothetical protein n=1 Tax=Ensifer TaxID=106591 RepID=UPI000DDAD067|nr:hypothetical protein [Ensifer sp. ENS02]MBD9560882.1 hypothetical protein [Ensifer sp. ENS03]MBD9573033.1 hypothetical protein [Ensifer sp. ENS08]
MNELIAAGCDITAIGHEMYVIGEVKDSATEEVRRITEKYRDRDPLRLEIVAYLWSIGRDDAALALTLTPIISAVLPGDFFSPEPSHWNVCALY